jgi:hypothetical protein
VINADSFVDGTSVKVNCDKPHSNKVPWMKETTGGLKVRNHSQLVLGGGLLRESKYVIAVKMS